MKMKRNIIRIVTVVVAVGLIVGMFYFFSNGRSATSENMELSKVQQITTKNLDSNYPATPREVVK